MLLDKVQQYTVTFTPKVCVEFVIEVCNGHAVCDGVVYSTNRDTSQVFTNAATNANSGQVVWIWFLAANYAIMLFYKVVERRAAKPAQFNKQTISQEL